MSSVTGLGVMYSFTGWSANSPARVLSRIKAFLAYPIIANIISQKNSSFDLRQAMDERMIIIANLAEGKIGEEATNLLGSLLITKIQLAAMSREDVAGLEGRGEFGGRILRQKWRKQAKDLLAGKPPQAKSDRQRAERSAKAESDAANAAEKSDDGANA